MSVGYVGIDLKKLSNIYSNKGKGATWSMATSLFQKFETWHAKGT